MTRSSRQFPNPVASLQLRLIGVAVILACGLPVAAFGQTDVVVTRRKNSEGTLNRKGTIVQWKGHALTLSTNGVEREIDNDQVVDVRTEWSDAYRTGIGDLNEGKTQIAIVNLQEAIKVESREWAQLIIRAQLVDAYQSLEQRVAAVDQFLMILKEDPQTRFLHLAPLAWTGTGQGMDQAAKKWIQSSDAITRLIGASWLAGGTNRDQAIQELDKLSRDIDPRIKNLAIAQLWRVRVNANAKQVAVWQGIVKQMPRELRAGPYLVLAQSKARVGLVDAAVADLMRIPILYPEQRTLSAAALYRSGDLLHNRGRTDQAQTLLNELVTNYPQTLWARQAAQ